MITKQAVIQLLDWASKLYDNDDPIGAQQKVVELLEREQEKGIIVTNKVMPKLLEKASKN